MNGSLYLDDVGFLLLELMSKPTPLMRAPLISLAYPRAAIAPDRCDASSAGNPLPGHRRPSNPFIAVDVKPMLGCYGISKTIRPRTSITLPRNGTIFLPTPIASSRPSAAHARQPADQAAAGHHQVSFEDAFATRRRHPSSAFQKTTATRQSAWARSSTRAP
ncbi:MAG: hypothetical protein H7A53_05410 [Akkermansiaceae bacterium]|nr:hypothetical protein [Akkermansiaceae bacterium]